MINFGWRFSLLHPYLGQLKSGQPSETHSSPYDQEFYRKHLDSTFLNLPLPSPQPGFAIPGRSGSLSNKINTTASINPLIWTALTFGRPSGTGSSARRHSKSDRWASPIFFVPRTLWRTWGTRRFPLVYSASSSGIAKSASVQSMSHVLRSLEMMAKEKPAPTKRRIRRAVCLSSFGFSIRFLAT
jgi:hypothetical protein